MNLCGAVLGKNAGLIELTINEATGSAKAICANSELHRTAPDWTAGCETVIGFTRATDPKYR
ncbi:hypothetical protein J7F03_38600, partial [Streptomyces sp. ISL-43]|uniref:hypothetical protein n=1 Tax=Streptomyces sp. ISL-43 TaxID=2819183 RepID=UPI001BEA5C41